jgi:hypothetical protein
MTRRKLIAFAGTALLAWPMVARAQQAAKVSRIGYLRFSTAAADANNLEALRAGLRALGHVEGKNLVIEFRWAETVEQLQEAAAELVRMNVDVIFALSSTETERAIDRGALGTAVTGLQLAPAGAALLRLLRPPSRSCPSSFPPAAMWQVRKRGRDLLLRERPSLRTSKTACRCHRSRAPNNTVHPAQRPPALMAASMPRN